jgi:hypothetical protein
VIYFSTVVQGGSPTHEHAHPCGAVGVGIDIIAVLCSPSACVLSVWQKPSRQREMGPCYARGGDTIDIKQCESGDTWQGPFSSSALRCACWATAVGVESSAVLPLPQSRCAVRTPQDIDVAEVQEYYGVVRLSGLDIVQWYLWGFL